MNDWRYVLYAIVLAIVACFTREIVTFVMLGFILLALGNIGNTLRQIHQELKRQNDLRG
ncbi:hypothetical protein [Effusibacillus pohliae]|uniref:hypothetical protein n=1 Tax=Effusibacillus pohliae TaxID=232270 RepID=UPI000366A1FD|nr:hypothetical protein [Effusibacillus pohliae]